MKFRILFIGDGEDTKKYKEVVKKYNMEKESIFLGRKKNPYPYFYIHIFIFIFLYPYFYI